MEALEIKAALEGIKAQVETKGTEQSLEVKGLIEALEVKMSADKDAAVLELKADLKAIQDHADKLDLKLQSKSTSESKEDSLVKSINDNFVSIKEVRKGNAVQTKVVGDMALGTNLTGAANRDHNNDVVMMPGQAINVSDLIGSVSISGGTYTYPRESVGEGAIAGQTEGVSKSQRDYDFTMIDVNTDFLAGFTRYSKKMANNLPFLTSFIPQALRRDYAKAENASFNTVLAAAATASTIVITGNTKAGMLVDDMSKLEDADYMVNGIVVRPSDYYTILKTPKDQLAAIVTFEGGQLRLNGINVYKATWLAANRYFIGDWSRINKIVTEGLSLEFSEVEGTNFVKNNITARIEAQVALAVEQPAAIVYGNFIAI